MDQLPAFGRAIFQVVGPTLETYSPLLLARESEIRSTRREEYSFGPHERQTLDVYYPSEETITKQKGRPQKVLVFVHGGGFVHNSKRNEEHTGGLTYGNLAHFFATRFGDVAGVVRWIAEELPAKRGGYEAGTDVFLLGNSAGGVHTATYALEPALASARDPYTIDDTRRGDRTGALLRGIILLGMPAHWKGMDAGPMQEPLTAYYGTEHDAKSPVGLVEATKERGDAQPPTRGTPYLALTSELDPDDILQPMQDFVAAWPWKDLLKVESIPGHNHISPTLGLATGIEKEEEWGVKLAAWCESCVKA
ncbi:alpha/beta-hydrolase [Apiospora sp. TS-2023a]